MIFLVFFKSRKQELIHAHTERFRISLDAQRTIDEFLRQERNEQQQDRKRKKNGDLE